MFIYKNHKLRKYINVDNFGIEFQSPEDNLTWVWPWRRREQGGFPYESDVLNGIFLDLRHYRIELNKYLDKVAANRPKVIGVDMQLLIKNYVRNVLPQGCYVSLYDINPTERSAEFWNSLPREKALALIQDVAFLRCKDYKEMKDLCDSIEPAFATALGWSEGAYCEDNKDGI
jgi:hypothetical protein